MWCGGSSLLLFAAWLFPQSTSQCSTKRFADSTEMSHEDPLRRRTLQSLMISLLGASTTTTTATKDISFDSRIAPTTHLPPSLFTRSIQHPFSGEYTLQPPSQATITINSQHHVQWTLSEGWHLDAVLQMSPTTATDWNNLVHQRLLQVQQDENCVVTCREDPYRLSSHSLELVYVTTQRPWHLGKRHEWRTRVYWNDKGALLSVHCHGPRLPEPFSVPAVFDSIVFR